MDSLLIEGPAQLSGRVRIHGSKNAALPLLFASLLFDEQVEFENVPRLWDVETTLKLLETMGAETTWDKEAGKIAILPTIRSKVAPYEWVKRMRAGVLALGPLVARYGEARVSLPGGCAIGARPVDYHIQAMKQMGVSVQVEEGYVRAQILGRLQGTAITFPRVTVTGTENILYLAACAEGETQIENAAREPEVVALGEYLAQWGAKIEGLGTSSIRVVGASGGRLQAPRKPIRIPPDRIATGTWIATAAATRSPLTLEACDANELSAVLDAFREMGVTLKVTQEGTQIEVIPTEKLQPISIDTQPYPGFPTDMQAQILVNLCLAQGKSQIRETIFENRFMHVAELKRLGAKITVRGNEATVEGPTQFQAAPMMATDLRASASLVIAALCARGQTHLSRIYHLDRGYQKLDDCLRRLGAKIQRLSE